MENTKKAILVDGPVGRILFRMTIPMIFGLLSLVAFNLVDTYFVGQLGTPELAALSFTFPVVLVIGSLALGLGAGSSAVISRAIGKGDNHKVQRLTTDSLVLAMLIVAVFVVLGLRTINPLFTLLGASSELIPLISDYMRIWYLGVIFVIIPMVGNHAIRATGDTKTPGLIMFFAALINVVLDPLLIFGLGPFPRLGLTGAALATLIARATTFFAAIWILYYREKMLTLELPSARDLRSSWTQILYIGLPSAGTRIIIPIAMGVVTRIVAAYGPAAVAGFGVSTRLEFFSLMVVLALSTVLGPFIGQNWAANRHDRLKLGVNYSNRFSMIWGIALFIFLATAARPIASIFSDDPEVISTIILYFWIVPISYGLQGVLQISTTALNFFHRPIHAAAILTIQMFVLYIPLAYLGSNYYGLKGIFSAIVLAYSISGIASHFVLQRIMDAEKRKHQSSEDTR